MITLNNEETDLLNQIFSGITEWTETNEATLRRLQEKVRGDITARFMSAAAAEQRTNPPEAKPKPSLSVVSQQTS